MTHDHSCNWTPGRVLFAYPACRLPKRDMDSLRINCLPGTRFGGLPSLGVYPDLRLQSSVLVNIVFLAQEEHCDGLSMRERVRGGEKRRPWSPFALIEEMVLDRVVRAHTPGRLHETPGECLEDIWSMILRPGEHVSYRYCPTCKLNDVPAASTTRRLSPRAVARQQLRYWSAARA